jgi:hypothetical protein
MNWDAVSAVAEVIGALAVVSTLIYLAVQTKHNALAVNQSAQQAMVAEMGAAMGSLFANPEGAEIWLKGIASYSSLTAVEKVQLTSLFHQFARTSEQAYYSFRVGTLDAEIWEGLEANVLEVFSSPGMQEWWSLRSHWYSEAFQSLIDNSTLASTAYLETLQDAVQPGPAIAT